MRWTDLPFKKKKLLSTPSLLACVQGRGEGEGAAVHKLFHSQRWKGQWKFFIKNSKLISFLCVTQWSYLNKNFILMIYYHWIKGSISLLWQLIYPGKPTTKATKTINMTVKKLYINNSWRSFIFSNVIIYIWSLAPIFSTVQRLLEEWLEEWTDKEKRFYIIHYTNELCFIISKTLCCTLRFIL